jgi:hypothetical protein
VTRNQEAGEKGKDYPAPVTGAHGTVWKDSLFMEGQMVTMKESL